MKKVLLIIALGLLCLKTRSQTNYSVHLGVGTALGAGVIHIPHFKVHTPERAAWIGSATGFMAGLSKEFHDIASGSAPSTGDLLFTTAGGLVGAITSYQIKTMIAKRKAKKLVLVRL